MRQWLRPETRTICVLAFAVGWLVAGLSGGVRDAAADTAEFTWEEGVLGEAPYRLAIPDRWNGQVLLLAHGWRPPDAPLLAVLEPQEPLVAECLAAGWLVAATGYRRNGWILEDAAADLEALTHHIAASCGEIRLTMLEGTSLGANVGLLIAERESPFIDGVVALAADPHAEGPDGRFVWTHLPRIPLLMLSNRDEWEPVADYVGRVGGDAVRPALWRLDRDGHVNLNEAERYAAFRALLRWVEDGVRPRGWVGEPFDATIMPAPRRSIARSRDGGLEGWVLSVDPVYGNLVTDLVEADLEQVAGREGARFMVRGFGSEEKIRRGTTYTDVKPDQLVAFVDAEGCVRIAVNRGNAADRLSVREGDTIHIRPLERRKHDPRR